MEHFKESLKGLLPRDITKLIRFCKYAIQSRLDFNERVGFKYGFMDYDSAANYVKNIGFTGYQEEIFVKKLVSASRGVRDGTFVYERDTVTFPTIQYSWPLLTALLYAVEENQISVLDYGGGLGTTYRQNHKFLAGRGVKICWKVLEQEALVQIGRREFSNEELIFVASLDEEKTSPDIVIFGGSLCYLPRPWEVLQKTFELSPKFIVFDRTPFVEGVEDLFAVQFVPPEIYSAALPIVSFSQGKFSEFMESKYSLIVNWICDMQPDPKSVSRGSLWRLKN